VEGPSVPLGAAWTAPKRREGLREGYAASVEEDFYSVDEAARILRLTPGRIRQMLRAGELEGLPPEEGSGRDLVEDGRRHIGVQQSSV
jgi:hypothetical protein